MRPYIICFLIFFSVTMSWSQSTSRMTAPQTGISNINRLYLDYEIKDNDHPDPALLQNINLALFEYQRLDDTDVEILDGVTDYTIILYSTNKVILNKKNHTPTNTNPNNTLNEKD
jgi:hypothetical protein